MLVFQGSAVGRACVWLLLLAGLVCPNHQVAGYFYKIRSGTQKEFELINCKQFNKTYYTELSRVCDDCQNIYRKYYNVGVDCKKDCFDNEWFPKCVTYLEHDHLLEEYKKMKEYLNLRDL
uniref:Ion transport protein n=1 Tax=Nephrops norvegicus TaxID=6829 RepID=A0A4D6BP75_NEPNO|nr:ion transport protein [Nephrops norvegicus]